MTDTLWTRRAALATGIATLARPAFAQAPALPTAPVALSIIDVAGNL